MNSGEYDQFNEAFFNFIFKKIGFESEIQIFFICEQKDELKEVVGDYKAINDLFLDNNQKYDI